jgi:sugar lactone lactonase YvrE
MDHAMICSKINRSALGLVFSLLGACGANTEMISSKPVQTAELGQAAQALDGAEVPSSQRARFFAPSTIYAYADHVRVGLDIVDVNDLFLADTRNHTIRRIEPRTGLSTTVAGTKGLFGSNSSTLASPAGVAVGGVPQRVFIADTGNHTIRYVDQLYNEETQAYSYSTTIVTLAGTAGQAGYGSGSSILFSSPQGVAIGATTQVGSGPAYGVRVDDIYVADTGNAVIRRIHVADGSVTLVAGTPGVHGFANGAGASAKFNHPTGLVKSGNKLFVADMGNHVIRAIDLTTGATNAVSTLVGIPGAYGHQDGDQNQALFAQPVSVQLGLPGLLVVADRASYTVREIDLNGAIPTVRTIAGRPWEYGAIDGNEVATRFRAPGGAAVMNGVVYVSDTANNLVRGIRRENNVTSVSTLTGSRTAGSADGWPEAFSVGRPSTVACDANRIFIDGAGVMVVTLDGAASSGAARVVDSSDYKDFQYAAESLFRILGYKTQRLDLQTGAYTYPTDSNSGEDTFDAMLVTSDYLYSRRGSSIQRTTHDGTYIDDQGANTESNTFLQSSPVALDGTFAYSRTLTGLRKANLTTQPVTYTDITLALVDEHMIGLAVKDNLAYFTTNGNGAPNLRHTVRRMDLSTGEVTVFAGALGTTPGTFANPNGLCISGAYLYVADTDHGAIQRVALSTGSVETVQLRRAP